MLSSINRHSELQAGSLSEKTQCVRACVVCYQTCQDCGYSSLVDVGLRSSGMINRLLDCASICMACALLIARESDLSVQAADICVQACEKCIEAVTENQEPRWEECLQACSEAAANCREYIATREPE